MEYGQLRCFAVFVPLCQAAAGRKAVLFSLEPTRAVAALAPPCALQPPALPDPHQLRVAGAAAGGARHGGLEAAEAQHQPPAGKCLAVKRGCCENGNGNGNGLAVQRGGCWADVLAQCQWGAQWWQELHIWDGTTCLCLLGAGTVHAAGQLLIVGCRRRSAAAHHLSTCRVFPSPSPLFPCRHCQPFTVACSSADAAGRAIPARPRMPGEPVPPTIVVLLAATPAADAAVQPTRQPFTLRIASHTGRIWPTTALQPATPEPWPPHPSCSSLLSSTEACTTGEPTHGVVVGQRCCVGA